MKAFPQVKYAQGGFDVTGGMDLRDYFAAKVLQGFYSAPLAETPDQVVSFAYKVADKMMEARKS